MIGTVLQSSAGWVYEMFTSIRTTAISCTSAFTNLALATACIITVFLTIRLANNLMSDEQQGGIGGVTMWEILRPLVIIFTISFFPTVINVLDKVTNSVVVAIVQTIPTAASHDITEMAAETNKTLSAKYSEALDKMAENAGYDNFEAATQALADMTETLKNEPYNAYDMTQTLFRSKLEALHNNLDERHLKRAQFEVGLEKYKTENPTANAGWFSDAYHNIKEEAYEMIESDLQASGTLVQDGVFVEGSRAIGIDRIAQFFYDWIFLIFMVNAEILLCVLALLGPWSLVVSLLPPMKNAFTDYCCRYLQLSFWKAVGTAVNWAVQLAIAGSAKYALNVENQSLSKTFSNGFTSDGVLSNLVRIDVSYSSIRTMTILISIAGIMALFKVPSIAAMIIPAPGPSEGGGAAGTIGGTMAGAAMNAPKKIGGGIRDLVGTMTRKGK